MKMNETVAGLTITAKTEGVDQAKKQVDGLTQSTEQLGVASETSSKGARSLEDNWKRATLRFDEAARSQAAFAQQTKLAEAAVRSGNATQQQATEHLARVAERYGLVTAAIDKMAAGMSAAGNVSAVASQRMVAGLSEMGRAADAAAKATAAAAARPGIVAGMSASGASTLREFDSTASQRMLAGMSSGGEQAAKGIGLARHELINLSRQAQDVGVSLVSGQSPLMILAQQGSQIADVFISSGKSVGSFFSQAIGWGKTFFTSTLGIVSGIAAIGAAAVYATTQFLKASTTIEQALENENRLLKEGKALIDARTSAEARAQLNPKDLTEYEIKRNLLDVQRKLNEETRAALIRTAPRQNLLGSLTGEFAGEAPLTPGMEKVIDATDKLKAAQAAGLPGMKEYNAELGRIATAHPELAKTVDKMIELGRTGIELENAEMRLRAMSDALKGIATDAQLAAVGLGSIAQFQLNYLQADKAREATERQAKAVLEMAQAYPGISIEVAKQLTALQGQLQVAQARTGLEATNVQYYVTQRDLLLQGKTLEEAMAVAAAQRAVSLAQVNAEADRTLKTLQQEGELIRASSGWERDRIKARQTYNDLIEKGVDASKAGAIAAQQQSNARAARDAADATKDAADATESWSEYAERARDDIRAAEKAAYGIARAMKEAAEAAENAARAAMAFVPFGLSTSTMNAYHEGLNLWQSRQGGYSQFRADGYTSTFNPMGTASILGSQTTQLDAEAAFNRVLAQSGGNVQSAISNFMGAQNFIATAQKGAVAARAIEGLPSDQQAGSIQALIGQLQTAAPTVAGNELIKQLNDKLTALTAATSENTSATSAMTDVLSPFYSSDPRSTHLGFRAFAGGGIMTQYGELPLKHYQGGGMATSPQVAVFGEGSTPEAYVPVPSGRIPVELRGANSNQRPVNVTINVMGNADAGTVAALKQTSFQKAQQLRRITG